MANDRLRIAPAIILSAGVCTASKSIDGFDHRPGNESTRGKSGDGTCWPVTQG